MNCSGVKPRNLFFFESSPGDSKVYPNEGLGGNIPFSKMRKIRIVVSNRRTQPPSSRWFNSFGEKGIPPRPSSQKSGFRIWHLSFICSFNP